MYSILGATTLIYVKPYTPDFNANCRCLCFDLFVQQIYPKLSVMKHQPTNHKFTQEMKNYIRIGRLGVIVNFTKF